MKLTVLGVGGAGSRLAARLAASGTDDRPFVVAARAFDTDPTTFATLSLPDEACRSFQPDYDLSPGDDRDADAVRAGTEGNVLELRRVASEAITAETDGVLLAAGLGGATGAGATPVLANALAEFHDLPIYALSVLPGADETADDDAPGAANAAAGLRGLEATVDAQLLFDNDHLAAGGGADAGDDDGYASVNATVAEWVSLLFDAGEVDRRQGVGERMLDVGELVATLGESGYATLGYRREQVAEPPSLLDRLLSRDRSVDSVERYSTIETAVRRALLRHRSADDESVRDTAERALLLAAGPPEWLDREALADGRALVSEETDGAVVRGADAPVQDGTDLQILVVCAGLDRPERVEHLLARDVE